MGGGQEKAGWCGLSRSDEVSWRRIGSNLGEARANRNIRMQESTEIFEWSSRRRQVVLEHGFEQDLVARELWRAIESFSWQKESRTIENRRRIRSRASQGSKKSPMTT